MTAAESACTLRTIPSRPVRMMAALRGVALRSVRFRLRCLILGHEDTFARKPGRLMLRCATCGRETAGWTIGPGAPVVTAARRTSPSRGTEALATPVRVGPWTLREGRVKARDRERQRLVAAASRAAERSAGDIGRRVRADLAG